MEIESTENSPLSYKFDDWILHIGSRELELDGERKALEPLIFDLLVYFVENADRVVSRQDLVSDVWQQKFVDDNAINRAISELRKHLQNPEQKRTMIKTLYKKGYKFVPHVEAVLKTSYLPEENQNNATNEKLTSTSESASVATGVEETSNGALQTASKAAPTKSTAIASRKPSPVKYSLLGLLFIILVFVVWFYMAYTTNDANESIESANGLKVSYTSPVTSRNDLLFTKGLALYPLVSQNQQFLAYSYQGPSKRGLDIFYLDLNSYKNYLAVKTEHEAFPVAIDDDGNLIYQILERLEEGFLCTMWFAPFSQLSNVSEHKKILDCEGNMVMSGHLFNNAQTFVYSKSNYRGDLLRSAIYHRNLSTGEEYQMTSPSITTDGDETVAVSADGSKVVFYRDTTAGGALYLTNIEGSELTKLIDLDYTVSSLRWNDQGNKVSWLNYVDWELNTLAIETQELSILKLNYDFSVNKDVAISVASENRVIYASDYIDNDIYLFNLDATQPELTPVANSLDKELSYLPLLGDFDAVFLKRVNNTQLWLKRGHFRKKIMDFDRAIWPNVTRSPDASMFLVGNANVLSIFDANTVELKQEIELAGTVSNASWFDNNTLILIKEDNEQPKTVLYNIEEGVFIPFSDIRASRVTRVSDNKIAVQDFQNTLHILDNEGSIVSAIPLGNGNRARWATDGSTLYFGKNFNQIWQRSLDGKEAATLLYDLQNQGLSAIRIHPDQNSLLITVSSFDGNTLYDVQVE